jgi:hypothetical protein
MLPLLSLSIVGHVYEFAIYSALGGFTII